MDSSDTLLIVAKARAGDRDAWTELLDRYYERWLQRYHGQLGHSIRRLCDTEDLVQSAVKDAIRDIPRLRNEAAFYTWVTSIIRHKIAIARRRIARAKVDANRDVSDFPDPDGTTAESDSESLDSYIHTLDVILDLFPEYPEPMAAIVMKLLESCSVDDIVQKLGRSERTVYRWLREGMDRLKARLEP